MVNLGRLEEVDVRVAWSHEAHQFTPWLLEHSDQLADVLGIDLELEAAEHRVGDFALDLIGRDLTHDAVLIVENQLEATDHSHLGQILTYTAGTDASTIVWLARTFRPEHRQALDWLNEQTHPDLRFFGIEIRVVRIGDSPPAPWFSLVAEPNDWQKQVRASARAAQGSRAGLYEAFWAKYLEKVREAHPDWTRARKPSNQNWMGFLSPIKGTRINPSFAQGQRLRHELYIDAGDREQNLSLYNRLLGQRSQLEAAYGRPLEFEELPNAQACRIAEYFSGADVEQEDRHDEFIDWFIDAGERLRRGLSAVAGDV